MNLRLKDISIQDRPIEKLIVKGSQYLSDSELLAILIHTGSKDCSAVTLAQALINEVGSLQQLFQLDIDQLTTRKYLGYVKGARIKAAFELGSRLYSIPSDSNKSINRPEDAYRLLKTGLEFQQKEHLAVANLNNQNKVISVELLSMGTFQETISDPREIFKVALAKNAKYIILAHNHPSGNINPSPEDITATNRVKDVGNALGINILDHIIVGNGTYASFRKLGLLQGKFPNFNI